MNAYQLLFYFSVPRKGKVKPFVVETFVGLSIHPFFSGKACRYQSESRYQQSGLFSLTDIKKNNLDEST